MGQPPPSGECSSKYTSAVVNATAPWAKLKIPDVWYVSTRPAATIAKIPPDTAPLITRVRSLVNARLLDAHRRAGGRP
jgi:hypothetical protein